MLNQIKKMKSMRTCCCHSKSYRTEDQAVVCLNVKCNNYMAQTGLVSRTSVKLFTGAMIFCFILCFCKNDYSYIQKNLTVMKYGKAISSIPCTDTNLKTEIKDRKIICPDEVYAQVVIESGHMTSFLTKRANNLLGMRYPYKRA